jgi:hypothetical protein
MARNPDCGGMGRARFVDSGHVSWSRACCQCRLCCADESGVHPPRRRSVSSGARELAPLRRQAEAAKSLPESQKWAATTRLWTHQIRIQARFNTRFRALGLPSGDVRARNVVAGLDRGLVLARRVRNAFATRSTAALAAALPVYVRFTVSLNRRVAAYGFKVCAGS